MNTDDFCAVIKVTVNTKIKVKYITLAQERITEFNLNLNN